MGYFFNLFSSLPKSGHFRSGKKEWYQQNAEADLDLILSLLRLLVTKRIIISQEKNYSTFFFLFFFWKLLRLGNFAAQCLELAKCGVDFRSHFYMNISSFALGSDRSCVHESENKHSLSLCRFLLKFSYELSKPRAEFDSLCRIRVEIHIS